MSSQKRIFENWLSAYEKYTEISEAPSSLHFWVGVSTIAGALQRKVWIENYSFQWTPNFYIVLVGPAGVVTKSTSIRIGYDLLREVPGVHFGPNSLTWQALTKSLAEAQVAQKIGEKKDGEPILMPMACITCSVSELGTFLQPGEAKFMDVFTDLWDGQLVSWEHATATTGKTKIINPWINLIAATTPAWLRANFPESLVGGGLTSRIIFVYADKKKMKIAYPGLMRKPAEHEDLKQALIHDLKVINEIVGEYALTEDAVRWGIEWYERLEDTRPPYLASERFDGYMARKQGHLHKIAMVLAAAQRNERYITKEDLEVADKVLKKVEASMVKVFESIGVSDSSLQMREILSILDKVEEIIFQDLWRMCCRTMSLQQFKEALDAALRAGFIKAASREGKLYFRREKKDG